MVQNCDSEYSDSFKIRVLTAPSFQFSHQDSYQSLKVLGPGFYFDLRQQFLSWTEYYNWRPWILNGLSITFQASRTIWAYRKIPVSSTKKSRFFQLGTMRTIQLILWKRIESEKALCRELPLRLNPTIPKVIECIDANSSINSTPGSGSWVRRSTAEFE